MFEWYITVTFMLNQHLSTHNCKLFVKGHCFVFYISCVSAMLWISTLRNILLVQQEKKSHLWVSLKPLQILELLPPLESHADIDSCFTTGSVAFPTCLCLKVVFEGTSKVSSISFCMCQQVILQRSVKVAVWNDPWSVVAGWLLQHLHNCPL